MIKLDGPKYIYVILHHRIEAEGNGLGEMKGTDVNSPDDSSVCVLLVLSGLVEHRSVL